MKAHRVPVKYMKFSAAGLVALLIAEGFSLTAIVPTLNDVWTYGFGLTWREDGTPVQKGDTITPTKAVQRSQQHIEKDELGLKRCVTADLTQNEYDTLVDFSYQYGVSVACISNMVQLSNAGKYAEACEAYLGYRYMTSGHRTPGWEAYKFDARGNPIRWRFDCSTPRNRVCAGVWTRSQERRARCLGERP